MKLMNALAIAGMAVIAAGLVACGKTKNDSNASTPASTCVRSYDGTLRDQYGRSCNQYGYNSGSCVNARYYNGQYYDLYTNQPISCQSQGYFDGYNSVPYYGQNQYGTQFAGCQGWSQVYYGTQYVPVDLGNGQLICMNTAYLYQQAPQYNWNNAYYYQQPVYTCQSYDCYGGSYGGYNYSCTTQLNLGFNFGYGSAGIGMCL
ncbi:MAG: hypothetical protein KF799_08675 [Bdellovibrionales bacterium]|nr:hypothetical protein [Bdellovibrionales bacterium]